MKNLGTKLKALLTNPVISRALHTFWQGALAVLLVGLLGVHTTGDAKLLLIGAVAAGLSAVKTMAVSYIKGQRS
jgi:hypothetical protein